MKKYLAAVLVFGFTASLKRNAKKETKKLNMRFNLKPIVFLALLLSFTLSLNVAWAAPRLRAVPSRESAGTTVNLSGAGFIPGAYTALILWDGVEMESFFIPLGGDFRVPFTIPFDAAVGEHEITVCAKENTGGCTTGDFEQRATGSFLVTEPTGADPAIFDLQIQAIEVTQGLRTDIPTRVMPTGTHNLIDSWTHVTNRRTVVRVYPWVDVMGPEVILPVNAVLYGISGSGILPGSPISPVNGSLHLDPSKSLDDMRRNAADSWNFVLPESWTDSVNLRLLAIANPSGPRQVAECPGCGSNNDFILRAVQFRPVQIRDIDLRMYVTEMFWRDAVAGDIQSLAPTSADIAQSLGWWLRTAPIDPDRVRMTWNYARSTEGFDPMNTIPGIPRGGVLSGIVDTANVDALSAIPPSYIYIPIILSHRSHPDPPRVSGIPLGCTGKAAVGIPVNYRTTPCGPVFAQEAAHMLGLPHACNTRPCPHGDIDPINPSYPDNHGSVEANAFGFDIWDMVALPPDTPTADHTHDFMSYGGSFPNPYNPGNPMWVSRYTWAKLVTAFGTVPFTTSLGGSRTFPSILEYNPSLQSWLLLSGGVDFQDKASFDPAFLISLPEESVLTQNDPEGTHSLVLLGDFDKVLFERQFTPHEETHENPAKIKFFGALPITEGVRKVLFRDLAEQKDIAHRQVSINIPTVELTEPTSGTFWPTTGETVLSWKAVDEDEDEMIYRIEVSGEGKGWTTIAATSGVTNATIDLSKLPVCGGVYQLRVQASDGFNVGSDMVSQIKIAPCPPRPLIVMPLDGDVLSYNRDIEFMGFAGDPRDGALSSQALSWFIDEKLAGHGTSIRIPELAPGKHVISLKAVNSSELSSEMQVTITVLSIQRQVTMLVSQAMQTTNGLEEAVFKGGKKKMDNLIKKMGQAREKVVKGENLDAIDKLDSILNKMDGCAAADGIPDNNDKIIACALQGQGAVYPLLLQAFDLLKGLV